MKAVLQNRLIVFANGQSQLEEFRSIMEEFTANPYMSVEDLYQLVLPTSLEYEYYEDDIECVGTRPISVRH